MKKILVVVMVIAIVMTGFVGCKANEEVIVKSMVEDEGIQTLTNEVNERTEELQASIDELYMAVDELLADEEIDRELAEYYGTEDYIDMLYDDIFLYSYN